MKAPAPRGVSLIEILVAASLLALSLLAISSTFLAGAGSVDQAGRMSRAVAIAQEKIEVVKSSSFPPVAGNCPGTLPPGFTCSLGVGVSGSGPNRLATVTVTVNWTSAQRAGSVSLATRIAE